MSEFCTICGISPVLGNGHKSIDMTFFRKGLNIKCAKCLTELIQDLDFTTMDTIFQGVHAKNQGRGSQVREAVAIFGGRRNPNERRVARKH
jgi:hypothetical protein